jgi:hypothetical protein
MAVTLDKTTIQTMIGVILDSAVLLRLENK